MRRLLIGLSILTLAGPAGAQPAEGVRLLEGAIQAARGKGALPFRLRCANGCTRARETLSRLSTAEVVRARTVPCKTGGGPCHRIELERTRPRTLWWTVDIETRPHPDRPIRRIEISGP